MSLLDQIVGVQITRQTVFPTVIGFGIPLLLAYHVRTPNMIDIYSNASSMLDDGFTINDRAYQMALKAFSQNPSPKQVVIGRRLTASTLIIKLLPKRLTVGFIYDFIYTDPTGVKTEITYTVALNDTALIIGTALKNAIDALAGSTAVVNGGTGEVTVTASVAGAFFNLSGLPNPDDLHVANTTTDPGIAGDYAAVKAVDASTWYGITIDSPSKAEIEALAAPVEADKKIFAYECSDSDIDDDGVTTDVGSQLAAAEYARTFGYFAQEQIFSDRSTAEMAKGLALGAKAPGSNSWAFLTLNSVTVDNLKDGQETKIMAKRVNIYVETGGLAITYPDLVADNEHIDVIVGSDWLFSQLQSGGLALFYNRAQAGSKVPYTDAGAQLVVGMVMSKLTLGTQDNGQGGSFLAPLPKPTCTAPKVADIDPSVRAQRILPDVNFNATIANAINAVQISGTLSL